MRWRELFVWLAQDHFLLQDKESYWSQSPSMYDWKIKLCVAKDAKSACGTIFSALTHIFFPVFVTSALSTLNSTFSSPIGFFPFKDILYDSENSTHLLSLFPSTWILNEQEKRKKKKRKEKRVLCKNMILRVTIWRTLNKNLRKRDGFATLLSELA